MEEIWKTVKGYDGYEVSSHGRIRSLDRWVGGNGGSKVFLKGKILKPYLYKNGYFRIALFNDGDGKEYRIHRLVAEAFIPNPDNLPCVNHKDETRTNNHVDNLEWCSYKYNTNYGSCIEKIIKKTSKKVYQYTVDGELVREWVSATEVHSEMGYHKSHISACCNGKRRTAYGYKWSFIPI